MEKRIELCKMKVGDVKTSFGNPRKINKKKLEQLKQSFEDFGDFGIFLINEKDEVIAGNMRLMVLREIDLETEIDCKRLIGYTDAELKAINIKDNTHSGEWDLDLLADWTADLQVDLDLGLGEEDDPLDRSIQQLEPIRYEKYDYVLIVCKNEMDYNELLEKVGIEKGAKCKITEKKKIKGRAIFYDKSKLKS